MKRLNISISNILPIRKAWLGVGLLLALSSCTDLNEQLYDKVSQDDYGKTQSEVATIVGGAYATLRGYGSGTPEGNGVNCYPTCEYVFFTQECSSDEACIPTRGTDWFDGGRYQQYQRHNWDANNAGILSIWRYNFTGVSKVNAIIYQVDKSGLTDEAKNKVKAELRGLRAYYYYNLLDCFGNVPISTDFTEKVLPTLANSLQPYCCKMSLESPLIRTKAVSTLSSSFCGWRVFTPDCTADADNIASRTKGDILSKRGR